MIFPNTLWRHKSFADPVTISNLTSEIKVLNTACSFQPVSRFKIPKQPNSLPLQRRPPAGWKHCQELDCFRTAVSLSSTSKVYICCCLEKLVSMFWNLQATYLLLSVGQILVHVEFASLTVTVRVDSFDEWSVLLFYNIAVFFNTGYHDTLGCCLSSPRVPQS